MPHKAILISLERQRAADCVDADVRFISVDPNLRRETGALRIFWTVTEPVEFFYLFFLRRQFNLKERERTKEMPQG